MKNQTVTVSLWAKWWLFHKYGNGTVKRWWGMRCGKQMKISSFMVCDRRRGILYICIIYVCASFLCGSIFLWNLNDGWSHGDKDLRQWTWNIWNTKYFLFHSNRSVNGHNCVFFFSSSDAVFNFFFSSFHRIRSVSSSVSSLCGIKPFYKWKNLKLLFI